MARKRSHTAAGKQWLLGTAAAVLTVSALWCGSFVSYADTTATVTVDSAKIREKADTASEAVNGAVRGDQVTIIEEVNDASGTLWYKVNVGNTTGYIRSDLVSKEGEAQTAAAAQPESSASGASVEPGQAMDAQYATVVAGTAKVRTAPSTNEAIVDRLTRDTQVVVSGMTEAGDGKKWYYVTFTGTDGAEKTGYIRSDLLTLGDMVPVPEEEETPEPEENVPEPAEPEIPDDYELTYGQGTDGAGAWYLVDHTEEGGGKQYSVEQLMKVTKARSEEDAKNAKTLVRQRIVIVVLCILLVALIAAAVIMALKLRDVYYEDYEDEDEEDEAEEAETPRRRREQESGEEETPRRRRGQEAGEETSRRSRGQEPEKGDQLRRRRSEEQDNAAARRRRRMDEEEDAASQADAAPRRKAKNFLIDDDEFEFEFLNMDDKN